MAAAGKHTIILIQYHENLQSRTYMDFAGIQYFLINLNVYSDIYVRCKYCYGCSN